MALHFGLAFGYTALGEIMFSNLKLDGTWELAAFEPDQDDRPCAELPYAIPARVPGQVHPALFEAGAVDDRLFETHPDSLSWVDQKEWRYRRTFRLPDGFLKSRSYLVFDGLDTLATVTLNGELVGTSHNMFIPQRFDVTGRLNGTGQNALEVGFAPACRLEEIVGATGTGVRKMRLCIGPNSTPALTGAGIWRGVRVIGCDRLSIRDIHVLPVVERRRAEAWLTIEIENHAGEPVDALAAVVVARGESREKMELREVIPARGGVIEAVVRLEEPQLWWPNGMGEQPMYTTMAGLQADGDILDVREQEFGLRTIEILQGQPGLVRVNGERVPVRAAVWAPPDPFPARMTGERYRKRLTQTRDSKVNLLRVWSGGVYEDPIFYRLCDELGIMIWQDFMLGWEQHPASEGFYAEIEREVREVVRTLRNHPSLAVWCGAGPGAPDRLFDEIIPRAVRELDAVRVYTPAAPAEPTLGHEQVK